MKDDVLETKKRSKRETFKTGIVGGLGWAFGVTIGFAIISVLIIVLVDRTSVTPVIGDFVTSVVEYTQQQLETRNPYFQ
jgi:hypothetical protein